MIGASIKYEIPLGENHVFAPLMPKRIVIELDEVEAAAFTMLRAECLLSDPSFTEEALAKSMILGVLEDDLIAHQSFRSQAH